MFNYEPALYNFIKILEKNKEFETEVKRIRKEVNLSEAGYAPTTFIKMLILNHEHDDLPENVKELLKTVTEKSIPLLNSFNIPRELVTEIPYLIISNMIHANAKPIYVDYTEEQIKIDYFKVPLRLVTIRIANKLSKNEFIDWINKNWTEEFSYIQYLPEKPNLYISPRDFEIVRLKDKEKLTFREIAEAIVKKYKLDDPDARINENSVKMAYKRAKDSIKSLNRVTKT